MCDTEESSSAWQSRLLDCLNRIQTTGDISWAQSYNMFVNPGLEIDGRQIPLPLCPSDAQAIRDVCRPAPFGMVDQTVVDDSVRQTWQLDHSQFRLRNPSWEAFLKREILAPASEQLGLVRASAKLHKLLLYEQGSFFKRHRDSQKEPGMVGTLVVCLPSEHEGGEVRLSFKLEKRKYATGPASTFDLTALAWFSDISHEIEELTSGYRLVLTYNIVIPTCSNPCSASFFDAQTENLQRILADWQKAGCHGHLKFYYPLEHKYSRSSLNLGHLKGRDAAVCQLLHHTASAAGFYVLLASMTFFKDEYVKQIKLDSIYTCYGELIGYGIPVRWEEIPSLHRLYNNDDAADSEDVEYLGNEEEPLCFRYHNTVRHSVLYPASRCFSS